MPRRYPDDFRDRAMRLVDEAREGTHLSEYQAIAVVAGRLGVSAQALTRWRQRARVDAGLSPGVTSEESAELKRLRRENAELKRANEILRTASAFFVRVSTVPRRDDPIRGHVSGSVRGLGPPAAHFVRQSVGSSPPGVFVPPRPARAATGRCVTSNSWPRSPGSTGRTSPSMGSAKCMPR